MKSELSVPTVDVNYATAAIHLRIGDGLDDKFLIQRAQEELRDVAVTRFYLDKKHINFAYEGIESREITREVVDAWLQVCSRSMKPSISIAN